MMTNKKLYAAIVENAQQMNDEQVNQISEEFSHSNDYLLESFSESYKNALESFTAQTIEIQKQQNEAMLSIYKYMLEDLKHEQESNSKRMEQILSDIKNICGEQKNTINDKLDDLSGHIKSTISEMKKLIDTELQSNTALTKEMHNCLVNIDKKISEQSQVINSSCEFSKKACEYTSKVFRDFSNESKSEIIGIKDLLSEFSNKQDKANEKYNKEMKRSIEDGFESSTETLSSELKPVIDSHYKEIIDIDKKIENVSSNYEKQFNIIIKTLQKTQDLSSKDIQILEKLVKVGNK